MTSENQGNQGKSKAPKEIDMNQFYPPLKGMFPLGPSNFPFTLASHFPFPGFQGGAFGIKPPKQNRIRKLDIYSFNLDQRIGQGYSSIVYRGINDETKEEVSIKIIDYLSLSNNDEKLMIENEIKCLKKLKSDNVLKLLDVLESKDMCYIVTEMCESGDLFKLLQFKKSFTEQEAIPILKGVANALLELKSKKIIHRDLKPSNVLLKNNIPKLADFGFAIQEEKLQAKEKFNLGSPIYMSLEVLKGNRYSYASDIFAYGIMAYELLHRVTPWECNTEAQLLVKIESQPVKYKEGVSQNMKELINKCLEHDLSKRITIENVVELPIFK